METEKEIFKDLWNYLKTYNDPPTIHDPSCEDFWYAAGKDLTEMVGKKWDNHPLAMKLGLALIVYIEDKSKGGERNVQKQ